MNFSFIVSAVKVSFFEFLSHEFGLHTWGNCLDKAKNALIEFFEIGSFFERDIGGGVVLIPTVKACSNGFSIGIEVEEYFEIQT